VVAGAGIGGLTLAAALVRRGAAVRVLERAERLAPVGAGITVQPNAMLALARIGLAERVAEAGERIESTAILDERGRVLSSMAMGEVARAVGQPAIAIHRARLHEVLLEAVGEGVVVTGRPVTGYRDEPGTPEVVALVAGAPDPDHDDARGALLVGADGLRSAVRAQLARDGEPRYAGYTSWRGVARGVNVPAGHATESWGRGARFGIVPIGRGEVYWFAVSDAPAGSASGATPATEARAQLEARFASWHEPVRALVAATAPEHLLHTDITDRVPLQRWTAGRVCLLGDAAHPMTPNLGQGGCQAIEDAIVLDSCLATGAPLEEALGTYAAKRIPRANRVVVESRRVGAIAQWSHPLAVKVRDTLLRVTPAASVAKRLERSLRFEP
jgi:2-polyprenyl-6-methoxyphenol hydroxylase-like FAD-dependent oxidoreductase